VISIKTLIARQLMLLPLDCSISFALTWVHRKALMILRELQRTSIKKEKSVKRMGYVLPTTTMIMALFRRKDNCPRTF
jgi:hypothetical protein